ncbi:MAG: FAD-binding oxidoreductase, partial [Pseudomonadota bacterium]
MSAIDELKTILGPQGWLDAAADVERFCIDWRRKNKGEAMLVARPNEVGQVQEVVRICNRHGIAIVPQGGNSSLAGAAVPNVERPTIILSLGRLNRIREIRPQGYSMTVEAGCIIQNIQSSAQEADRTLGLDFGARGTAVIGGAIGTNAGGLNVVRYGPCRDQVMGLEIVLADGTLIDGLSPLRKDNTGYAMKHLFIGAEGTLGVVTAAS